MKHYHLQKNLKAIFTLINQTRRALKAHAGTILIANILEPIHSEGAVRDKSPTITLKTLTVSEETLTSRTTAAAAATLKPSAASITFKDSPSIKAGTTTPFLPNILLSPHHPLTSRAAATSKHEGERYIGDISLRLPTILQRS